MPSGHSLVAAYLATCLYFYIIDKYKIKKKKSYKFIYYVFIIYILYNVY